jgi:hypothetical protein
MKIGLTRQTLALQGFCWLVLLLHIPTRAARAQTRRLLEAAFDAWREHIQACAHCPNQCAQDGLEPTGMFDSLEKTGWIDYREVFQKVEERGKTTAQTEIALNAFRRARPGGAQVVEILRDFGISDDTIKNARNQIEAERAGELREKKRSEPEQ